MRLPPGGHAFCAWPHSMAATGKKLTTTTFGHNPSKRHHFWVTMGKSKESDLRPYHHGDLRRAIVTAALEILSETQSVEFSLRELGRRAGVSHNAPYKHFAEKSALLAAVSAAGFDLLTKRIADQIARIRNPRAQLFVILRTYIRFGVENPG